jgi:L-iditol 2-dehydrogenase
MSSPRFCSVARLHAVGDLRVSQEAMPVPGPDQSLVRVEAVGLCGSDLHWYDDGGIGDAVLAAPLVLGHEFAGVVEGGPLDGRRVAVDPALPCGRCIPCRGGHRNLCPDVIFAGHGACDGGLRDVLAWPTTALHPLPPALDGAGGALLEPLGVALHAFDLGHVHLADEVAVIGCGPIGLLLIQVLRLAGARPVLAVDPLTHRRAAAERAGAENVLAPEELDRGATLSVDVAFEVAGPDAAVDAAIRVVRPGGRVVLAGIPTEDRTTFSASAARRKGLTLVMVRRMGDAYPRAIRLVEDGQVELDWLVTDRYPLARVSDAFAVAAARSGLKVIVEPNGVSAPPVG